MADTVNQVADMVHELAELRTTNESLSRTVALQQFELDALRVEAVMLRAAILRSNDRASAMDQIMRGVSEGLISGIRRMESMDADTRRRQQAEALASAAGGEPPPEFIGRLNPEAAGARTGRLPPAAGGFVAGPGADGAPIFGETPQPAPQPRQSTRYVPTDDAAPPRPAPTLPEQARNMVDRSKERIRELASRPVVRSAEPAQRGIRTDIVDDRLPKVTPGDNADTDGLLAMHALINERGTVR